MNSESIAELKREIDDTRDSLDQTLRALQLELSPRHQMEVAWRLAKNRTQRGVRGGADLIRANPTPALLAAFALGGMLSIGIYRVAVRQYRSAR